MLMTVTVSATPCLCLLAGDWAAAAAIHESCSLLSPSSSGSTVKETFNYTGNWLSALMAHTSKVYHYSSSTSSTWVPGALVIDGI